MDFGLTSLARLFPRETRGAGAGVRTPKLDALFKNGDFVVVFSSHAESAADIDPKGRAAKPLGSSIGERFLDMVRAHAERPAIFCGGDEISYFELDRRARAFAALLKRHGVGRGSRVGLFANRSPEAVAAILGILRLGAAFVPLDPAFPHDHLKFIAADANPAAVVCESQALASSLEPAPWSCATLFFDAAALDGADEGAGLACAPDDVACIMYTSGTTGRPKGVMIPHRGVVRLARNTYIDLCPNDVVLHGATLAFDASTFEIFAALLNGAALAVLSPVKPSFSDIGAVIADCRVTTALLTTGLFHAVVDHHIDALAPLRQLVTGGDVLSPGHARRFLDAFPGCRLVNAYGPTENSTITCCYTLSPDASADAPVPIGRPIARTRVHVLDDALRPVAPGEIGELFAAGEGVALGYLNRPDLTAEKFLPDAFDGQPGALMYRTGDLVRPRADGVIEFVGRADRQVKINGKRVELEDVEAALRRLPRVAEAAAAVRELGEAQRQIIGYVGGRDGARLDAAALRQQMQETAPAHMIPAHIVALERLPLTPSGKVDRAALPLPDLLTGGASPGAEPPASAQPGDDVEAALTDMCRRLLKVSRVGPDANFFDLGGSSLDLMAFHEEIQAKFGRELPMTTLFEYTNIRALAARLKDSDGGKQPIMALNARKLQQNEAIRRAAKARGRMSE